jgi:glycosyltransferase involved in cell wall biosynthesis
VNKLNKQPIRVLHIIGGLGIGGAELMLKRLVLAQISREAPSEVAVVSLTTEGAIGSDLRSEGVSVYSLGLRGPLRLPLATWRLCKILWLLRPKCVQTWMPHADLFGGLVARFLGIRAVIWGVRSTDLHGTSRLTKGLRILSARLSKIIPSAIVCAARSARDAHVKVGYDSRRMIVVPNGYDTLRFAPSSVIRNRVRSELAVKPDQILIGHVGRWNSSKDPLNFVRSIGILKQRGLLNGFKFKALMVGRGVDPQLQTSLNDALKQYDCGDLFIFTGERGDVHELLTGLDLFCLSSRDEAFPNVLAEAMATAVPCVTTDVGDASWIVGDTGWIVQKEDPYALADAITLAITEPPLKRATRGELARVRIVERFSLNTAVERFIQVQNAVVNREPLPVFE